MKVIHIIPSLNKGGAERLVLEICKALGVENDVRIITFGNENAYANLYPSVQVTCVPASVSLSVTGKNVYHVDALQKEIELFAPDVIHTHLFETEIVSRSCHYPHAKWFSHAHDNMPAFENFSLKTVSSKNIFTRFYEKRFLFGRYKKNGGNTFITISASTFDYFKKTASEFDVKLLPNAIDFNRFYSPVHVSKSPVLKLVSVGSLVNNKNQIFLLEVGKILHEKHINFELHVLGDGPNLSLLQQKAEQFSMRERIHFHGNVDLVENHLREADIYVHSSKSEALGLTLIEAMAAGLPVVTLDGGGNRDLMEEGKNGYLVHEQNASEFAEKIITLWENKMLYKNMAMYAQQFARKYDIALYIQHLLRHYSE